MVEINIWMNSFLQALQMAFADRIWFVGLQGSYGRGEATATSDIDIVVILDKLAAPDIEKYNAILDTLPYRELICGFLSGKTELYQWERSDLFQFCYDTKPVLGSLDEIKQLISKDDVERAIKIGACNIYHSCVHNMLHKKSDEMLKGLYKSASFVVQAIAFRQTGGYIVRQKDLLQVVSPEEQKIVEAFLRLKNGDTVDYAEMSETLFVWSKKWIEKTSFV